MAEEDTGTTEDTGTEEETEEESGTGEGDAFKPPTEEDWKKTQGALRRAQSEAKRLRLAAKGKPADKPADKPDPAAEREAQNEARLKRSAGIAALAEEGMTRAQAKVAVRLLDMSQVQLDDDGDADGIDDLIDDLKEVFPALFAKQQSNGRAPRVTTADKGGSNGTPSSTEAKMDQRMLRQAGYR